MYPSTRMRAQFGVYDIYRLATSGYDSGPGELICSIIGLGDHAVKDVEERIMKEKKEGTWKIKNGDYPTYDIRLNGRVVAFADPICGIEEL